MAAELQAAGLRVWLDDLNETVSYKVRKGEKQKIPYILVVGEREMQSGNLNVRIRGKKEVETMAKDKFIERVVKEVRDKV